jgi:SAM-dependent methyltransferase
VNGLGYPEPELARVPDATVESFAGVANHWLLHDIEPGSVVLDLGCGAGTDLLIAAQMGGADGRVIGVDMTSAMLERAAVSARAVGLESIELHESLTETLPLEDASVDVVISNGVIDLVPDKEAVFAVADVIIHTEVSEDARARIDRPPSRSASPSCCALSAPSAAPASRSCSPSWPVRSPPASSPSSGSSTRWHAAPDP